MLIEVFHCLCAILQKELLYRASASSGFFLFFFCKVKVRYEISLKSNIADDWRYEYGWIARGIRSVQAKKSCFQLSTLTVHQNSLLDITSLRE